MIFSLYTLNDLRLDHNVMMLMMMLIVQTFIKIIIVCHIHSTPRRSTILRRACVFVISFQWNIFCIVVRATGLCQDPALIQCAQQVMHNYQRNMCKPNEWSIGREIFILLGVHVQIHSNGLQGEFAIIDQQNN